MTEETPTPRKRATLHLTHKAIERARLPRPGQPPSELWHSGDTKLGVRVYPSGTKKFFVMPPQGKRRTRVTLGSWPTMTLEQAFDAARNAIKAAKTIESADELFESVVERFLAKKAAKKPRTYDETKRHFEFYILADWRGKPIRDIRRRDVNHLMDKIEEKRIGAPGLKAGEGYGGPVQADRVLTSLSRLFNWYMTRDDEFMSPVVKGMKRTSIKARARKRVLNDAELRALWTAAPHMGLFGRFVQTLLLTAQRRNEVLGMLRSEWSAARVGVTKVDLWTIPPERYKTDLENLVPLSATARAFIDTVPVIDGGDLVFTLNGKTRISNFSKQKTELDEAMEDALGQEIPHWTLHDLRRTAKTLMQRAGVRPDISERVLGHAIEGVEGTYDRYDYLKEKREALEALAGLVERIAAGTSAEVVPLTAKSAAK